MMFRIGGTRKLQQQQHQAASTQRPVLSARHARSSRAVRVAATATAPAPASAAATDLTKQVVADEAQYVLQTYARPADIVFVKGEGSKLYDANGKEYLDMAAGAACRTQQRVAAATLLPAGCCPWRDAPTVQPGVDRAC